MNRSFTRNLRQALTHPGIGLAYGRYRLGWRKLPIGVQGAFLAHFSSFSQWLSYRNLCPFGPEYVRLIERLLRAGEPCVCLDVGANIGLHSLAWAAAAPGARILAFEPLSANLACLEKNLRANGRSNVEARQAAVSEVSGTVSFRMNEAMPQNAKINVGDIYPCDAVAEIAATTIDDLVEHEHLAAITLLKVDAEGAEARILRGARSTLQAGKIHAAIVEFGPAQLADFGDSPDSLLAALLVGGGTLRQIGANGRLTPPLEPDDVRKLPGGDLLFLSEQASAKFSMP